MSKVDTTLVQVRVFEIELALEAAFEAGYRHRPPDTWGNQAQAYNGCAFEKAKVAEAGEERRKAILEANLRVLNAAGQALQANGNALEAVSHLVDNMGRLS